ncbi:MAG: hypothetical protein QXQ60_03210 [Thermofilum sp.]
MGISVADSKLIQLLRRELQQARDILSELGRVIDDLNDARYKEENLKRLDYIRELKKAVSESQTEYLSYLSKVGRSLVHREEWVRIGLRVMDVLDKLSGITYRLSFLIEKSWLVPSPVQSLLSSMCSEVNGMVQGLESILIKLQGSPSEALEELKTISALENRVDEIYRSVMFEILSANISGNTALLLLSVAEMLENSSDTLYELTNNIYIILLDIV